MPVEDDVTARIHIDGEAYEVQGDRSVLQVSLQLGFDLPYFCWHPALGSVGACRQCAIKQFKNAEDEQGKIVMACMTPASDGTRISIADPEAVAFRAQVIEWLMLNHPHDCPVCDEGGECHLQDMTVMTGHAYRRTRFPKRTFRNQNLGPLVNHEMNRCIACYRCVRFYRDYAGGGDLDVLGAHDDVYFGRHEDGALESPFAGNLVEVCPTGVFTDKTLAQHYTRKWDLQAAPSICTHCALGCNITVAERYGMLRRIVNRYNGAVNGYFLCDRGRFGYEFVNDPKRLRTPRVQDADGVQEASAEDAVLVAAERLSACDRVIGIGSPRASLEANFALRSLVGAQNYFTGLGMLEARLTDTALRILREGRVPAASLREVEEADAVLVLGEDVETTAPRLSLSLRQSVRNGPMRTLRALGVSPWLDEAARDATHGQHGPLYLVTPAKTSLDDVAAAAVRAVPDDAARLAFAVAHELDASAPGVEGLDGEMLRLAIEIARALGAAERPLVVTGSSGGYEAVLHAAANVAWALERTGRAARILITARDADTIGVSLLGGATLEAAQQLVRASERVGVIVLEHDLLRSLPAASAEALFSRADTVVALDHVATGTVERAHVALPAGTFAESEGTFVSSEGRAQRFFRVFAPDGHVKESWRWLGDLAKALGREGASWGHFDELLTSLCDTVQVLAGARDAAPGAGIRLPGGKVPRQPARHSGRTAIHAREDVSEPQAPVDPESALAYSMEGSRLKPPPPLLPMFWAPGWNSIQAVNKFQDEISGPLRGGDPGVRLFSPAPSTALGYFNDVPRPFEAVEERWLVLPVHHVFGSEELSARAPGVAQLAPQPYVALAAADAERLSLEAGATALLSVGSDGLRLPVVIQAELPAGVALLPTGLASLPVLGLPALGTVKKVP
jgi:NADH-quinone oxidoreductase subunit G